MALVISTLTDRRPKPHFIAKHTIQFFPDESGPPFLRNYPFPHFPWRIVPGVLIMTALQDRKPMALGVAVKIYNFPIHAAILTLLYAGGNYKKICGVRLKDQG